MRDNSSSVMGCAPGVSTHHATQTEVASVAVMVSAWQARTSRGRQMNSATAPNTGSRMEINSIFRPASLLQHSRRNGAHSGFHQRRAQAQNQRQRRQHHQRQSMEALSSQQEVSSAASPLAWPGKKPLMLTGSR